MNEHTSTRTPTIIWPTMKYDDAPTAIRFLVEAFGFEERQVVDGPDPDTIAHAELAWPGGGGVMLGSRGAGSEEFDQALTGVSSIYVVIDDPDALHARAMAAGAEEVIGLRDEDYGSRGFTVRDPGGNLWTFGTYPGA